MRQNPNETIKGSSNTLQQQHPMVSGLKLVCVPGPVIIGAGPSGLAAAACLKTKGIPFLILEKGSSIGSLWKFGTYDRLQLHLPKKFCELPYLPFPPHFPAYPTKQQFISYMENYAKDFTIKPLFRQEVRVVQYDPTMGFWQVQASEYQFICRWVIVATGENAEPVVPDIQGMRGFKGRILHTSSYKDGAEFKGKKVLVVGCGNSGMEVSLDLFNSGADVSVSVRNKLHILPREVLGISTFALSMLLLKWFPVKLVDKLLILVSRFILGDTSRAGISRPEIGPLELKNSTGKTPVLDVGAFARIKSGQIKIVHGLGRFTKNGVEFGDGTVKEYDAVILATGYRSNVTSWLKEDKFFNEKDGYPRTPFPNNWKGNNGVYSIGFNRRGLLGAAMDAEKVAQDIARQWNSETRHLPKSSFFC
ncbi:Indole-3-pyruvate monooxygenase YUCCA6 [Linum perenne]